MPLTSLTFVQAKDVPPNVRKTATLIEANKIIAKLKEAKKGDCLVAQTAGGKDTEAAGIVRKLKTMLDEKVWEIYRAETKVVVVKL